MSSTTRSTARASPTQPCRSMRRKSGSLQQRGRTLLRRSGKNQVRRTFSDHDGWKMRIARDHEREDGCIGDPQSRYPMNPQFRIDNRFASLSHLAGSRRVPCAVSGTACIVQQLFFAGDVLSRPHLSDNMARKRGFVRDRSQYFQDFDRPIAILPIREVIRVNRRCVPYIARDDMGPSAGTWIDRIATEMESRVRIEPGIAIAGQAARRTREAYLNSRVGIFGSSVSAYECMRRKRRSGKKTASTHHVSGDLT